MLFQISDVSAIFAIVIYSSIPMIRYTIFGLRGVPQHIIEAAITSGCTQRQLLWKVKMPLAFPEIILGANQTLMFSLFMVMIAGFIGTVDLSQEIFRALSFSDGSSGRCGLTNKRAAYDVDIPGTENVRRSDDPLKYDCVSKNGKRGVGAIPSTIEGAKLGASVLFIDLGITDAITDKHRTYPKSFVIPLR